MKKAPPPIRSAFARPEDEIPEGVEVLWRPHPGPQTEALLRTEDEILYGGAKGGGKTACGIIWLIKGNPVHTGSLIDHSYINHPHYRALVLRKNIIDLGDWIDKARRIYEKFGAVYRERPLPLFEFPSKAKIILGHLDDSDTYMKYQGQEFQRFLLEEATLVPDLKSFLMVRSCIRSVYPEMKAQTFLTANPGGPGHSWVRERYVKPKDAQGNLVPPGTTIYERIGEHTRRLIYIPAKLKDNPSLMQDPTYQVNLMALPEGERRAFLDGDWDALSGVYFTEFRPAGPLIGEPPQARHVIPATVLDPWLPRLMGMDWGFAHEGACYWGCSNSDSRLHIYRELVAKNLGAEQWGVDIALASLDDLRGLDSGHMNLFLSPDAWDKRNDTRTIADQIAAGILRVLGPDSVLLLSNEEIPDLDFMSRLETQRRLGITVRKAPNQRVAGAQYIRSQLRWRGLSDINAEPFDNELFLKLLHADSSRAMEYREAYARKQQVEVLPGLLIHDSCPRIIDTMQSLLYDETRPEDVMKMIGDDCYDAFRYMVFAHSKEKVKEPFRVFAEKRMTWLRETRGGELDGNTMVWAMRKAEADYANLDSLSGGDPVYIPRASGRRAKFIN